MESRTLYYALGGGLGHVTRTLALARQLRGRLGGRHRILANSPFRLTARRLIGVEPTLEAAFAPAELTPTTAADFIARQLAEFQPNLWIVDTFPRGLGGELAEIVARWADGPRVLIGRTLPEAYLSTYPVREFVERSYEWVLIPGEPSPWEDLPRAVVTEPFLIRNADELPSRAWASSRCEVPEEQGCVCVVGSGMPGECDRLWALARSLARQWPSDGPPLRFVAPAEYETASSAASDAVRRVDQIPLLELHAAVRLIIGLAGYNLFHETQATGVPALLMPQLRKYDDQASRVARRTDRGESPPRLPQVDEIDSLHFQPECDRIRAAIADHLRQPRPPWPPRFANGAAEAARRVEELVRGSQAIG